MIYYLSFSLILLKYVFFIEHHQPWTAKRKMLSMPNFVSLSFLFFIKRGRRMSSSSVIRRVHAFGSSVKLQMAHIPEHQPMAQGLDIHVNMDRNSWTLIRDPWLSVARQSFLTIHTLTLLSHCFWHATDTPDTFLYIDFNFMLSKHRNASWHENHKDYQAIWEKKKTVSTFNLQYFD